MPDKILATESWQNAENWQKEIPDSCFLGAAGGMLKYAYSTGAVSTTRFLELLVKYAYSDF